MLFIELLDLRGVRGYGWRKLESSGSPVGQNDLAVATERAYRREVPKWRCLISNSYAFISVIAASPGWVRGALCST